MIALNNGKLDLETECLLEIALANLDELGEATADELIDAWKEVRAAELPGVEA